MKWHVTAPKSISQWCLWASCGSMITVTAALSFTVIVGSALETGLANVLIIAMLTGTVGAIGLFVLSWVCSLAGR